MSRRALTAAAVTISAIGLSALAGSAHAAPACPQQAEVRVLSDGHGILESIAVDHRGRLFFTDSDAGSLLMLRRPGAEPEVVIDGVEGPGGIVFKRAKRRLLLGFGDSIAQAIDGTDNPEAGLLDVDVRSGTATIHTEGLQMANGIARGPGPSIYASNDIGVGGVDRVLRRMPELNWANVISANGMVADSAKRTLFVNQTFTAAAISRAPFDNPGAAAPYFSAAPADSAAGFDGLARDGEDRLYVAANGAGQIWRVDGPDSACVLAERAPFPSGPSDVAFGRKRGAFPPRNLYVTTFGGELLELVGARG